MAQTDTQIEDDEDPAGQDFEGDWPLIRRVDAMSDAEIEAEWTKLVSPA